MIMNYHLNVDHLLERTLNGTGYKTSSRQKKMTKRLGDPPCKNSKAHSLQTMKTKRSIELNIDEGVVVIINTRFNNTQLI